jgi:hypothetical protein
MVSHKLRFGIACRTRHLAAWQAQAARHLLDEGVAELALVILDESAGEAAGSFLWRWFLRVCRPRSMHVEDLAAVCGDATVTRSADVAKIRANDLDFILGFASGADRTAIASCARYGVWTIEYGNQGNPAGPPCFWEISRGEPTIFASLTRSTEVDGTSVALREGHLKIDDYLYSRSADRLCFEVANWPAYAAGEIARGVATSSNAARNDARRAYRAPSGAATLRFFWIVARNVLRRLFERRLSEEWNIGITRVRPAELLDGVKIRDVRWLPAISGGWAADPMAWRSNGKVHVLCEEMRLSSGKGRISATTFDGSSWGALGSVIEPPTHASYPFLFEHRGDIYCVPETFEAREIALYRARDFPTKWERVATLMSGIAAIDATLFEHDGLFWLFCTTSANSNGALLAFFARDVLGPWQPHAANPVKIDVRGSRPAGAPFRVDGQLYRPAQDSSKTYGGRVVIHRVVALTPAEFREEPCIFVEPQQGTRYAGGLHTLSFAGEYCIIDGKRWVRRASEGPSGLASWDFGK